MSRSSEPSSISIVNSLRETKQISHRLPSISKSSPKSTVINNYLIYCLSCSPKLATKKSLSGWCTTTSKRKWRASIKKSYFNVFIMF